jgi:tetratricopeptide (TPR) repeat protein
MLLTGGARDLPARQQRLRGTIDWSHGLLSEAERKLFARLSVFAGGCRVEAAQAVCDPDRELGIELLDGLAALVEQNLVRQTEDPDGEPRFGMLETIREYARERLRESAEVDEVLPRHAEHVLMLAENVAAKRREREPDWAREIEAEQENLRAALAWLRDSQAGEAYLRLAAAAGLFWSVRGQFREARRWLEEALVATGKEPTRARSEALTQASHVAWRQGDLGRARMLSEESMALAERLGDTRATANAFSHLAALAYSEANYQRARSLWETAAERFAELGELREWATAQSDLALMAIEQGDYARSRDILEQLLTVRHEIGDAVGVGTATTGLGYIALFQEHYADARQLLRDGLRAEYEHQTAEVDIANSLSAVAACLLRSGCIEAGIRVGEATKAFFEEAGAAQEQFLRDLRDDALSDVRGQIDGNEYVDARNAGRAMSIDAAVHYALAVLEPEPAAVPT